MSRRCFSFPWLAGWISIYYSVIRHFTLNSGNDKETVWFSIVKSLFWTLKSSSTNILCTSSRPLLETKFLTFQLKERSFPRLRMFWALRSLWAVIPATNCWIWPSSNKVFSFKNFMMLLSSILDFLLTKNLKIHFWERMVPEQKVGWLVDLGLVVFWMIDFELWIIGTLIFYLDKCIIWCLFHPGEHVVDLELSRNSYLCTSLNIS